MVLSEISEAKSELESEGLNSDEATELIQKIFSEIHSPKYKNNSNFFFGKKSRENNRNSGIRKTWSEALANMNQIMQVIHTNNYQFHQYCRKTKVYILVMCLVFKRKSKTEHLRFWIFEFDCIFKG